MLYPPVDSGRGTKIGLRLVISRPGQLLVRAFSEPEVHGSAVEFADKGPKITDIHARSIPPSDVAFGLLTCTYLSLKVDRGRPPNPIYFKGRSTFKEAAKPIFGFISQIKLFPESV